ncbi:MAG: hypothetical protein IJK67_04280 [Bacilli bacterium]|nr:hypothetical protein [Bacilli bacterium]
MGILGIVFNIIKPLWIWGIAASAITAIPASGLVLRNINKKDPDFKNYLEKRGPIKNALLSLKSIAKIFIPLYNVIHPFHNLRKILSGVSVLRDEWKKKILRTDDLLEDAKKIGTNTKKLAVGIFDRIRYGKKRTDEKVEESKVTPTKSSTQIVKPTVTQTKTTTPVVKPVVTQTKTTAPVKTATPVKPIVKTQETKPVTRQKTSHELLNEKLNAINASNYNTSEIIKYYKEQYWAARKRYDALLEAGMDTTEEMDRILLFYNKCQEFEQMRGLTQKPAQLVRK